ncbi:MAG: HEAT repeat domain-containing protein [Gemmatimonadetes bacterium]|nr:HEAT repeat domain-containing protein [Gemmatimonadota bacterium]
MTVPTAATPTQEPEDLEPPFSPQLVSEMLRQLDKTIRAHLLYLNNHNNPSYVRSLELARAVFVPLWAETESVRLTVTDTSLEWYGQKVLDEPTKASDSLPWTLFKDGLREITFQQGFEDTELADFLAIIPKVRHAQPNQDDLLTLLWEQEFSKLQYRYVDVSDESAPLEASPEPGRYPKRPSGNAAEDPAEAVREAKAEAESGGGDGAAEEQGRSGIVKMDDFDTTLYFLDEKEVEYLRQETEREYATDLRRAVLDSLLDIFEFQSDPLVRAEVLSHLEALMLHLLSAGQFAAVAYLLREAALTLDRARDVQPETKERLASLSARLSEPVALGQLLEAMDAAPVLPSAADLNELFGQLRPTALATVFAWLPRAQNVGLRPLLEGAATRIAEAATGELVKLIADPAHDVALEAIRRCGAMRTAAGVPAMARVLEHGDRELRHAALSALGDIASPGAMQAMEKALADADRDLRVQAARTLTARQYRPALQRAEAAVKGKELRETDRTERLAFFELYGSLCGDGGVAYLDGLLNAKGGLFARKEDPELRAAAAVALGRIGTAASKESLQRADGDKDVIVRTAVSRALRGGAQ